MGRRPKCRNRQEYVGEPLGWTIAKKLKNYGAMLLLFETPSGFALFTFSEVYFHLPDTLRDIWANFADPHRASCLTARMEFETFEDKSSAINADSGVNKRLADMIHKRHLPGMKLAVGKPVYKTIIESKLGIPCIHNLIVMEVMWGIQHLMHELVPKEKAEVAKDDRFPMSQGLKMFLSNYGFDVEPEMLNKQIVATACALFDADDIYKTHAEYLANASVRFKKVSNINCEHWGSLKLASALKVVCFPEEENNFHKVLSEDELLKLKEEAPKYKDLVSKEHCIRTFERISFAHQVRSEKKRLLGFLVKEAKAACEKGKLHRESEQIPQAHVMFANLCKMILPMISALKPPYNSTFCKDLSLGETGGTRIAGFSFSGAQPSTSKAIVPYEPIPSVLAAYQSQRIVDEDILNFSGAQPSTSKAIVPYERILSVNNIEKQVQVHASGGSGSPPRPPEPVSNPSPFDGKVLRRSPRLKTPPFDEVLRRSPRLERKTEDTRKHRKKNPASSLSLGN